MALSFIRSPRVATWKAKYLQKLQEDIDSGTYTQDNEDIWNEFKREFNMMTEKHGRHWRYISTFEELLDKLGWDRTPESVIERFKDGLMKTLLNRILDRDVWPESLDEWQLVA
ncbi:hypothetical protein BJV74DRAFT_889737 [Russula compacta]|nr:hypothetical protein BJV74DRAFT_889737 [Russula compacta]